MLVSAVGFGCAPAAREDLQSDASGPTARADGIAAASEVVDATTLERKMLFGYQGWFLGPGDGSPVNGWRHWFRDGGPTAANLTVDLWPDTSELGADELIATDLTYPDGSVARLYSAYDAKTVGRHFAWMRQAGIDGVALQRFLCEVQDPRFFAARNQVTRSSTGSRPAPTRATA